MANTTGTLTDAVLRMRRELPGWSLLLETDSVGYRMVLTPPAGKLDRLLKWTGDDDEWSAAAHRLVDEQIEKERG